MNDPFFVAYHMDNPHQKHVRGSIRKRLSRADIEEHGELESDVPTERQLWEHDSFYRDTKSLLNLFQLMGVMPIERSGLGIESSCLFHFFKMLFQERRHGSGFPKQQPMPIFYISWKRFMSRWSSLIG